MLDYKSIIIKRYALKMSYKELAEEFSASKSGINDFIRWIFRCTGSAIPALRESSFRSIGHHHSVRPEIAEYSAR